MNFFNNAVKVIEIMMFSRKPLCAIVSAKQKAPQKNRGIEAG